MREKMKGMSLKEKLDYLWTYYKIWLLVPGFAGVILHVAYSAYAASRENVLVNAVVVGAGQSDTASFEAALKKYMGKNGKYDKVVIQTNFSAEEQSADTMLALSTLIGAGAVDIFICPEKVYEHFSRQNAFGDMEKMMQDLGVTKVRLSKKKDAVIVSDSVLLQKELGAVYEEAYISVMQHTKHEEGKKAFLQYILNKQ